MKIRLALVALALLSLSACTASDKPLDNPSASPFEGDAVTPSPSPSANVSATPSIPVVVLPSDTEPPSSMVPSTPSASPSAPEKPVETPSPSGQTPDPSPSIDVSPSPSPSPNPEIPPIVFTGRVVPELPELTFEIYPQMRGGLYRADRLVVINEGALYQEIDLRAYSSEAEGISCAIPEMDFALYDMNYDGSRDFRVRDYATSTPNNQFLVFLWDQESMSFVFSPEISLLSNPEFDEANQMVHSKIVLLPDMVDSSFIFEDGELVLQAETRRRLDSDRSVWMVTVSVRIDGIMTVTDQYEEEYEGSI